MKLKCEETLDYLTSNPSSGLPGVVLAAFDKNGTLVLDNFTVVGLANNLTQAFSVSKPEDY